MNNIAKTGWLISLVLIYSVSTYSQTEIHDEIRELNKKGKSFFTLGQLYDAERSFNKTFGLYLHSDSIEKTAYIETLNGLARIYIIKGKFNKADTLLNDAISIQYEESDQTSLEYAETLNVFAKLKMELNQYADVENLLNKTIEIQKKELGKMHADYVESILNLGYYYLDTHQLDKAEKLIDEAIEIRKRKIGNKPADYDDLSFFNPQKFSTKYPLTIRESINTIKATGALHFYKGDFSKSDENYKFCVDYFRYYFGDDHPEYAEVLLSYSSLKIHMGKFDEAKKLINQACNILWMHFKKSHLNYALGLYLLGTIYSNTADYQKAESTLLESLQLINEIVGEKHRYYFTALSELAVVYQKSGMNENAEQYLIKSLELRKELFGDQHPSLASIYFNLAAHYIGIYNYNRAEKLLLQAINIQQLNNGESSPAYASMLSGLAVVYQRLHDNENALHYYKQALSISSKTIGESHPNYLTTLSNYVSLHIKLSKDSIGNKSIEQILIEICEKRKTIQGEQHPAYVNSLNNLAQYYDISGKMDKAETLYKKILLIVDEQNPMYLTIINNLGINQQLMGELKFTRNFYAQAMQLIKKQIEQKLLFISESEQYIYWNRLQINSHHYKTFFYNYKDTFPEYFDLIYDYELFSKALLLNSSRLIRQSIIDNGGEEALLSLKSREEKVVDLENTIMKELEIGSLTQMHDFLLSIDDEELIEISEWINEQRELLNQEEKELALLYGEFNQCKTVFSIKWRDIQKELNNNEVAIEFMNINFVDVENINVRDTLYCALLLCAEATYPLMIPLCNAKELQTAIRKSKQDAGALFSIIWQPIEKHLNGATQIYISPAGLLHSVSFAGIKKGNRYLCDEYLFHNMLSTKDIIRLKTLETKTYTTNQAVLFGGSDYSLSMHEINQKNSDREVSSQNNILGAILGYINQSLSEEADNDHSLNENNQFYADQETSSLTNLTRSMLDYMDPTRGQGFTYLAGSKKEVQEIDNLLSNYKWKTMLFTDKNASETQFKSFSAKVNIPSPRIIHVSTHGFYFPQPEQEVSDKESNIYRLSDNPLMRSGLVFSGANHAWRGGDPVDGMDDGILTAWEISNMNLTNTELVVLSACHTGLGDIHGSEGVFGLQRAFRLAGVQTMIVSLREVPDSETVELMTEFYSLWTQGLDKKKAFTQAQLKMRHLYPDNPEKWAGFIMIE